jgi:hypothetical protein
VKIQANYQEICFILFLAILSVEAVNSHNQRKYTKFIVHISNPCPKMMGKVGFNQQM